MQFLEAKGLTGPEIEEAMKQAASHPQPAPPYQPYSAYGPSLYPIPPQPWDWRDYFVRPSVRWTGSFHALTQITAVISGTVVYGAVSLFKVGRWPQISQRSLFTPSQRYMLPHLRPPTATAYEQDRDALTAQFDAAEALLREIQAETVSVRTAVEEQKEKVDQATKDVEAAVADMREGEARTRDEMREIRDEVGNIHDMLPKVGQPLGPSNSRLRDPIDDGEEQGCSKTISH